MCGFAGFLKSAGVRAGEALELASSMVKRIAHRGPDDTGTWVDEAAGIAFAHVRLSILDVSATGHQPMRSASGRHVIAFNGEIYNHAELRARIDQPRWRGHSDTEVLLACFDAWGVETTLRRAVGMFAFALWDQAERALYLGRDRMGEKPLYYGWQNGTLLFGSELKALRAHPDFRAEIDRDALTLFLRHSWLPAPYSIYRGIHKLHPGTTLKVGADGSARPATYWALSEAVATGQAVAGRYSDHEAVDLLETQIGEAVRVQRVADVPLGAFLSGGIDSSTVVSLMQAQSSRPVKTFTIGFDDPAYNEAEDAKVVARHLGTDHTELYVTPDEARSVIPLLPDLYDEPFGDSSQIPTFLVAKLARQQVTVSLSGDGGDELFGGYNRYFWADRIWRKVAWMPASLRRTAADAIRGVAASTWNRMHTAAAPALPRRLRVAQFGDKLHKLSERMASVQDLDDLYVSLVSEWKDPASVVIGGTEPPTLLGKRGDWPAHLAPEHRMMYLDAMTYLPDDILVKVDRAAMGVSLETRVPLLDHRVVELAWRLPLSMKIREGRGKWILRQVLHRHVPRELIERPKMGFAIPIGAWLRGPLKDWAEALLGERRLASEGFLRPEPIRRKWAEHLSGERDWQQCLWNVLMFQAWLERNR